MYSPRPASLSNAQQQISAKIKEGRVLCTEGQTEDAEQMFKEACLLAAAEGEEMLQGTAIRNLGVLRASEGRIEEAVSLYHKGLDIARRVNDRSGETAAHLNLGVAYQRLCKHEWAIEHYSSGLQLTKVLQQRDREAAALMDLAAVYFAIQRLDKAVEYYQEALLAVQQLSDRKAESICLLSLGCIYTKMNKLYRAIDAFNDLLELATKENDKSGQVLAIQHLIPAQDGIGNIKQVSRLMDSLQAINNRTPTNPNLTMTSTEKHLPSVPVTPNLPSSASPYSPPPPTSPTARTREVSNTSPIPQRRQHIHNNTITPQSASPPPPPPPRQKKIETGLLFTLLPHESQHECHLPTAAAADTCGSFNIPTPRKNLSPTFDHNADANWDRDSICSLSPPSQFSGSSVIGNYASDCQSTTRGNSIPDTQQESAPAPVLASPSRRSPPRRPGHVLEGVLPPKPVQHNEGHEYYPPPPPCAVAGYGGVRASPPAATSTTPTTSPQSHHQRLLVNMNTNTLNRKSHPSHTTHTHSPPTYTTHLATHAHSIAHPHTMSPVSHTTWLSGNPTMHGTPTTTTTTSSSTTHVDHFLSPLNGQGGGRASTPHNTREHTTHAITTPTNTHHPPGGGYHSPIPRSYSSTFNVPTLITAAVQNQSPYRPMYSWDSSVGSGGATNVYTGASPTLNVPHPHPQQFSTPYYGRPHSPTTGLGQLRHSRDHIVSHSPPHTKAQLAAPSWLPPPPRTHHSTHSPTFFNTSPSPSRVVFNDSCSPSRADLTPPPAASCRSPTATRSPSPQPFFSSSYYSLGSPPRYTAGTSTAAPSSPPPNLHHATLGPLATATSYEVTNLPPKPARNSSTTRCVSPAFLHLHTEEV